NVFWFHISIIVEIWSLFKYYPRTPRPEYIANHSNLNSLFLLLPNYGNERHCAATRGYRARNTAQSVSASRAGRACGIARGAVGRTARYTPLLAHLSPQRARPRRFAVISAGGPFRVLFGAVCSHEFAFDLSHGKLLRR